MSGPVSYELLTSHNRSSEVVTSVKQSVKQSIKEQMLSNYQRLLRHCKRLPPALPEALNISVRLQNTGTLIIKAGTNTKYQGCH